MPSKMDELLQMRNGGKGRNHVHLTSTHHEDDVIYHADGADPELHRVAGDDAHVSKRNGVQRLLSECQAAACGRKLVIDSEVPSWWRHSTPF